MMFRATLLLLMLACETAPAVEVVPIAGSEAGGLPNAYLLLGRREAVLVDTLERRSDVVKLGNRIVASKRKLTTIFITQARGEHLLGLAQVLERFPDANVVSTPGVIAEIRSNEAGLLSNSRRTYGDEGPQRVVIPKPLTGDSIQFEGNALRVLPFRSRNTEIATLYDASTRSFFAGDLLFNRVHLDLRGTRIAEWRAQLDKAEASAVAANVARVYPGHGPPGDRALFAENRRYLDDFAEALNTRDPAKIRQRMLARHPRHRVPRNIDTSIRAFVLTSDD